MECVTVWAGMPFCDKDKTWSCLWKALFESFSSFENPGKCYEIKALSWAVVAVFQLGRSRPAAGGKLRQQHSAAGIVGSGWSKAMSASRLRTVGVSWAPGLLDSTVLVGSYSKCEGSHWRVAGTGDVARFSRSLLGRWERSECCPPVSSGHTGRQSWGFPWSLVDTNKLYPITQVEQLGYSHPAVPSFRAGVGNAGPWAVEGPRNHVIWPPGHWGELIKCLTRYSG